jgi:peptide chain release factor 1
LPSGLVVENQTERSQHANRDKAMKRLKAALLEQQRAKAEAETPRHGGRRLAGSQANASAPIFSVRPNH